MKSQLCPAHGRSSQIDLSKPINARSHWGIVFVLAALAILLVSCATTQLPGNARQNPAKGAGIWTIEKNNAVTAINKRQEVFYIGEVPVAIVYGHDQTTVEVLLYELDSGVMVERDMNYIPKDHTLYYAYPYLQIGRYKVELKVAEAVIDRFFFSVAGRPRPTPPSK